jgi:hypothetical protein
MMAEKKPSLQKVFTGDKNLVDQDIGSCFSQDTIYFKRIWIFESLNNTKMHLFLMAFCNTERESFVDILLRAV